MKSLKNVKWKFKGTEVYFVSPEHRLASETYKQAARLGIDPTKTKIEIINEYFTDDHSAGCNNCNGNSTSPELTTLQMDDEATETGPSSDDMRDMFRLLDELDSEHLASKTKSSDSSADGLGGWVDDGGSR